MKRIGILSDTHGSLDPRAYAALADCDLLFHAGDIGDPAILRELETLAPVVAVLGNNDFPEYGDGVGRFAFPEVEGVHFLMTHIPPHKRLSGLAGAGLKPGDPLPQVSIHGHTHVPTLEWGPTIRPASLLLCPGAVFRPRGGYPRCVAKMEVEDGAVKRAWIESIEDDREIARWPETSGVA